MNETEEAHLHLSGVDVVYDGTDVPAVEGIDLEVTRGEAVALVGPSGSGKTTLLRLLGAVLRPSRGTVRIAGQDVRALSPRALRALRASIGTVHQDFALVPSLRVVTNVLTGRLGRESRLGALRQVFLPRRREVLGAFRVLERVGIGEKLYQRTDRLSGGQQQRVAVARALYQEPEVLLADEPVSSVDPARARDTMALLAEVCRERGLTLVASMHDVTLARAYFPRLVGLRHRRIVFDQPTATVGDAALAALYTLDPSEMLQDG